MHLASSHPQRPWQPLFAPIPNVRECSVVTCHLDPLVPSFTPAAPITMSDYLALRGAIGFARRAHAGQKRADGRPYLSHPLAVLQILRSVSLALPQAAYAAALLHDTVEDGRATIAEITGAFDTETAAAVDALTRRELPKIGSVLTREQAYLDRMLEAHERLPYVLLIKMADRLHNLETSHFLVPERRKALLHETVSLYLPLFRKQQSSQTDFVSAYHRLCGMLEESALRLMETPPKPFTMR